MTMKDLSFSHLVHLETDKSHLIWARSLRGIAFTFSGLFIGFELINSGYSMQYVFGFYTASVIFRHIFIARFSWVIQRIGVTVGMQLSLLLFALFAAQQLILPQVGLVSLGFLALWYGLANVIFEVTNAIESAIVFDQSRSTRDIGMQRLILALASAVTLFLSATIASTFGPSINHLIAISLLLWGINQLAFLKPNDQKKLPKVTYDTIVNQKISNANKLAYFSRGLIEISVLSWLMLMLVSGIELGQVGLIASTGAIAAGFAYLFYKKFVPHDHKGVGIFRLTHSMNAIGYAARAIPMTVPLAYGLHIARTVTTEFYTPTSESVFLHNVNSHRDKLSYSLKGFAFTNLGKLTAMALPFVLLFFFSDVDALRISMFVVGILSLGANFLSFEDQRRKSQNPGNSD